MYKKVVMHEFEHGLKVSYNNGRLNDEDLKIIKEICDKLSKTEYAIYCKKSNELNTININRIMPENWLHSGMKHRDIKIDNIHFLDEINNENESLIMAGADVQYYDGIQDMYYIIRNSESASSFYSSTIEMFNIIFGRKNVFELAYLNNSNAIEIFNRRYDFFFQNEFLSNKHAIEIFCEKLRQCKNLNAKLKLEEVLLKCFYSDLETRCKIDFETTLETWELIKNTTLQFSDEIMTKLKNSPKTSFFKTYDEIEQCLFIEKVKNFNFYDAPHLKK